MKLTEYIIESQGQGLSDDAILYRLGKYRLSAVPPRQRKINIKKFNISRNDPRPGLIRYMKADTIPLIKDDQEIIHRKDWNLDSLVGETEGQLLNKDYYTLGKYILQHHKRKHDILTLFQCSSKKPYKENHLYKGGYFTPYGEFTDIAFTSNPGIIPWEYCENYPYRYDEWNLNLEAKNVDDIVDLNNKNQLVNASRFITYVKTLGYKHVILVMSNPEEKIPFQTIYDNDIEGAKKWLHIVITDDFRDRIQNMSKYKSISQNQGMLTSRIMNFIETRDRYASILKSCLKNLGNEQEEEEVENTAKQTHVNYDKNKSKNESLLESKSDWSIIKSINYNEIMSAFKKYVDELKPTDTLYKQYYWSALDIMLIGLGDKLIKDIDAEYWKFIDNMNNNKDFEQFGDFFLFAYKPKFEKDNVKVSDMKKEAKELGILKPDDRMVLQDNLFNHVDNIGK